MKKIFLMITIIISTSASFANKEIAEEIESSFQGFEACHFSDDLSQQENEVGLISFFTMLNDLKRNQRSAVKVSDFTQFTVGLINSNTKKECYLTIDAYEGRCYYASCNK